MTSMRSSDCDSCKRNIKCNIKDEYESAVDNIYEQYCGQVGLSINCLCFENIINKSEDVLNDHENKGEIT